MKLDQVAKEKLIDVLGEVFHTAFRKAVDNEQAMPIHKLIKEMPTEDWREILRWVVDYVIQPSFEAALDEQKQVDIEALKKMAPSGSNINQKNADASIPYKTQVWLIDAIAAIESAVAKEKSWMESKWLCGKVKMMGHVFVVATDGKTFRMRNNSLPMCPLEMELVDCLGSKEVPEVEVLYG
jgi:hypothetical protein